MCDNQHPRGYLALVPENRLLPDVVDGYKRDGDGCDEDVDQEAFSPASSIGSSASAMSVSSSPVPSPLTSSSSSSSSSTTGESSSTYSGPTATHLSDFDDQSSIASSTSSRRRRRSFTEDQGWESMPTDAKRIALDNEAQGPVRSMPKATHKPEYDHQLQSVFQNAVLRGDYQEIEGFLINHSARIDLNKYDSEGQTPLHVFCSEGKLPLVQLLVRFGASTQLRTRDGWSALHIASFCGNSALLSFVLKCNRNRNAR